MPLNLNKTVTAGNLTRDPEITYTSAGKAIANVGVATNRAYTTEGGEKREETTFVDVEFWGRQAELAGEHLKKGSSIYVEGRLKLDTWDDKQTGQKRSKMKVVGEFWKFTGDAKGGSDNDSGGRSTQGNSSRKPAAPAARTPAQNRPPVTSRKPAPNPDLDDDSDIPF